jgi:predicted nucleic acid-binding protein
MSVSETALVDTGFWIALYDPREQYHAAANEVADLIDLFHLVMPWPIAYETLRTRFVRHREWVASFDERLKKPTVSFIDDSEYCDEAYTLTVEYSTRLRRDISMVDMVCRLLISDPEVKIDYLFTVNPRDFHDVCASNNVAIVPEPGG